MDFNPIDIVLHLDVYLDMLVTNYGAWIYAILFLVIFCETGLVVMPFQWILAGGRGRTSSRRGKV